MAVYTKKGDRGTTSLYDKTGAQRTRIDKDSLVVEALGAIDELDSYISVCKETAENPEIKALLETIQKNLLTIGTIIAGSGLRFSKSETAKLEKKIDEWEGSLPVLKNFVVPGGTTVSAHLQYARSLARRAERRVVTLSKEMKIKDPVKTYLNRLSDFIFMLARYNNHATGIVDQLWMGKKR